MVYTLQHLTLFYLITILLALTKILSVSTWWIWVFHNLIMYYAEYIIFPKIKFFYFIFFLDEPIIKKKHVHQDQSYQILLLISSIWNYYLMGSLNSKASKFRISSSAPWQSNRGFICHKPHFVFPFWVHNSWFLKFLLSNQMANEKGINKTN